jgi:hypothetical protein
MSDADFEDAPLLEQEIARVIGVAREGGAWLECRRCGHPYRKGGRCDSCGG